MTFTEIATEVCDAIGLTSAGDLTRVGRAINRKYREITASLGIKHVSRRTTVSAACTIGVSTLQFTSAEKVVAVYNRNVTPYAQLDEVTIDELRAQMPYGESETPSQYAIKQIAGDSVTIELNCVPQTALVLYADVYSTAATLSGTDEPVFSESYHDILISAVLIDEYLKAEKPSLSAISEKHVEKRMGELRHWIAVSTTKQQYQGKQNESGFGRVAGGSGGSGSSFNGAQSWTQTGLITFDRDPAAPFAVTASSAVVPNLDADKLDGLDSLAFARLAFANAGSLLFVDNTHDIGASGATRPRDIFLSRNADIAGALTFATALSANAAPLVLSNASAILDFSGATAPEIRFSGGTGLISSVNGITIQLDRDNNSTSVFLVKSGDGSTQFTIRESGVCEFAGSAFIADTSNAFMTQGMTIFQGGADDEIVALKSSDVAHAATDITEADTYGTFKKVNGTQGGLFIRGFSDSNGDDAARLAGIATGAVDTTKSTGAVGAVAIIGQIVSGTSIGAVGANGNLLVVRNDGTSRFILDADGDSHQDVGTAWTNFDDDDDLKRMDAVAIALARENDPLRHEFVKDFESRRAVIEAMPGKALVSFDNDGHHFVNMSRLSMLHHGAIRQIARELSSHKETIDGRLNRIERLLTTHRGEGAAELPA